MKKMSYYINMKKIRVETKGKCNMRQTNNINNGCCKGIFEKGYTERKEDFSVCRCKISIMQYMHIMRLASNKYSEFIISLTSNSCRNTLILTLEEENYICRVGANYFARFGFRLGEDMVSLEKEKLSSADRCRVSAMQYSYIRGLASEKYSEFISILSSNSYGNVEKLSLEQENYVCRAAAESFNACFNRLLLR